MYSYIDLFIIDLKIIFTLVFTLVKYTELLFSILCLYYKYFIIKNILARYF